MSSNKKIALTTGVLILLIIITAASIIAIFAAAQQTVNSEVSVTYKSENVSGTASAKYYVGPNDKEGKQMRVNGEEAGATSIDFNSKNPIETQTLSPVEKEIKLSEENYFVVFEYYFTNTNSQNDYMVKLSTSDSTVKNMKFLTEMSYEKVSDWQEGSLLDVEGLFSTDIANLNLTEIVPANKELYMYVIAKINNLDNDADFKLNFNWELGQIKATPEKLSFDLVDNNYVVKAQDENISGEVVIPAEVGGVPVKEIAENAFANNSNITSIVIPEGITKIGISAFRVCEGLTSVVIPNSVKVIDEGAFEYCENLRTLVIGEGVETIGDTAFSRPFISKVYYNAINVINYPTHFQNPFLSTKVYNFIVGDNVTNIPSEFLYGTGGFSSRVCIYKIKLGKSVSNIAENAFSNIYQLSKIIVDSAWVYNNFEFSSLFSKYSYTDDLKIEVLKSIVNDEANSNTYLNNPEYFNKDEVSDNDYVIYTDATISEF